MGSSKSIRQFAKGAPAIASMEPISGLEDLEFPSSWPSLAEAIEAEAMAQPHLPRSARRESIPLVQAPIPLAEGPIETRAIEAEGDDQAPKADLPACEEGSDIHAESDLDERQALIGSEDFVQWFQGELTHKLQAPETKCALKKNHLLVLMTLMNCLDFANLIRPSQREIAEMVGFPKSRLSAVLNVLEDLNFLTRNHGTSRAFTLMLNPKYFLKGRKAGWSELLEKYEGLRVARMHAKNRSSTK